jgi:uncharacterized protein
MVCPKCDSEMEKVVYQTIEVDRCQSCKGLWFDLLEHQRLAEMKGSESIDTGDPAVGRDFNKLGDVDCPVCKTRMVRMVDPAQPHIWFESCPVCYGVFFDAGEFTDYKQSTVLDFFRDLFAKERR